MNIKRIISNIQRLRRGGLLAESIELSFFEFFSRYFYPRLRLSDFGRTYTDDKEFLADYQNLEGTKNFRSFDRKFTLWNLSKLALSIPGDTVECGAFAGASSYFICKRIVGNGRSHHIFDSFSGLSEPDNRDGNYWMKQDFLSPEENLKNNLRSFNFVKIYKGWIPERFNEVDQNVFSFIHVDVDLYQPTIETLKFFYPRLSKGGVILADDYGFRTCPGARKAMDDFFKDLPEKIIELPTGQAFVIKG